MSRRTDYAGYAPVAGLDRVPDDRGRDVAQLPVGVLRRVLEHLERFLGVALVVAHEDALGLFDHRTRFEGGPELLAQGAAAA